MRWSTLVAQKLPRQGKRKAEEARRFLMTSAFFFPPCSVLSYSARCLWNQRKGVLVALVPISLIASSLYISIARLGIGRFPDCSIQTIGSFNLAHAFILFFSYIVVLVFFLPLIFSLLTLVSHLRRLFLSFSSFFLCLLFFYGFLRDKKGVHLGVSRWISHCRNPRILLRLLAKQQLLPPYSVSLRRCVKCDSAGNS